MWKRFFIWPIDGTLLDATTPEKNGFGSDDNKRVLGIPKAPALLEPHHQIA